MDERTVGPRADKTKISERTISTSANKTNSSKPSAWDVDSEDLNLQKWETQRNKRSQDVPKTYKMSLKGSAPGPSAKPQEQLKFVKRNIVKR